MALKKRFREAACNEIRFFFFAFVMFLVALMIVTTVATSLYFFKLCAKFSLRLHESSKVGACCPETDSVFLTKKFVINHQIIFLIWIVLTACFIQLASYPLFKVFWFELQKYLEKILLSLLFCFSQLLSLFFFLQFCNP